MQKKIGDFGLETSYEEDFSEYERLSLHDAQPGAQFQGRPVIEIIENEKYDKISMKLVDDDEYQVLNCSIMIPKRREDGIITRIHRDNGFTATAFEFLSSALTVMGKFKKKSNNIKTININDFLDYLCGCEAITIEVTEGDPDDDYNRLKVVEII